MTHNKAEAARQARLSQQWDVVQHFSASLTRTDSVEDLLRILADEVAAAAGVTGAGVTLVRREGTVTVTSAQPAIRELERLVQKTQCGPSIDARTFSRIVTVSDLSVEYGARRWPTLFAYARKTPVRAVAALPLVSRGVPLGSVGMYHYAPKMWTYEDTRAASILANIAGAYLEQAAQLAGQRRTIDQLQHALTSRIVIEQAKGMLAVKFHTSVDEAFQLLRRAARDTNSRMHDVCSAVVAGAQAGPHESAGASHPADLLC